MINAKQALHFVSFPPTHLINSIMHDHNCYILHWFCTSPYLFGCRTDFHLYFSDKMGPLKQVTKQTSSPDIIKLFSCSIQLNLKFQLRVKTQMLKKKDISYFQIPRCCTYHANKC